MYKNVIFDLDGTLLDTIPDITDCVNETLRKYSLPERTLQEITAFLGHGRTHLIQSASGMGEKALLEELCLHYDGLYGVRYNNLTRPYEGIGEALQTLQNAGIRMAVLSNKQHEMTVPLVREWFPEIRFDAVFGQRARVALKPEAGAVYEILDVLSARAEETAYIGDSDVDAQTAANAGVDFIAVTWGFRSKAQLLAAGARVFADTPTEMLKELGVG